MAAMTITRTEVARETARRLRRLGLQNGEEVRRMRLDAGVSLGQLADVVGNHRSHIARIENNQVQPSLEVLIAIGLALGADLGVRYFPGAGPRLHDRFQAAMVEAMLRSLDPRWTAALEVPVTQPSRGVIDLVLTDRASPVVLAVEVQSELRRLEQQLRWGLRRPTGFRPNWPTGIGLKMRGRYRGFSCCDPPFRLGRSRDSTKRRWRRPTLRGPGTSSWL